MTCDCVTMNIGRLIDYPTAHGGTDYGRQALDLLFDEANASGGLHGERVVLVEEHAAGSVERVIDGARRLAAAGCVLILGPAVTDFAVPLIPVLDELQVPAINWSGSGLARGAWGFQLKIGSLPDEAGHLTRLIATRGWQRVAVVHDAGPIGDEYTGYLRRGLDGLGVAIAADIEVAARAPETHAAVETIRSASPAGIVYLGFGPAGVALCGALRAAGLSVPVVGNIGLGIVPSPELEGVVFTDVVDATNPELQRFVGRYTDRYHASPPLIGLAAAHDLAMTALAALRLAPALTPAGVRVGLERIRGIPAAAGAPGTIISFAPWDRDGYKGPLIVYREIRGSRAVRYRL